MLIYTSAIANNTGITAKAQHTDVTKRRTSYMPQLRCKKRDCYQYDTSLTDFDNHKKALQMFCRELGLQQTYFVYYQATPNMYCWIEATQANTVQVNPSA